MREKRRAAVLRDYGAATRFFMPRAKKMLTFWNILLKNRKINVK